MKEKYRRREESRQINLGRFDIRKALGLAIILILTLFILYNILLPYGTSSANIILYKIFKGSVFLLPIAGVILSWALFYGCFDINLYRDYPVETYGVLQVTLFLFAYIAKNTRVLITMIVINLVILIVGLVINYLSKEGIKPTKKIQLPKFGSKKLQSILDIFEIDATASKVIDTPTTHRYLIQLNGKTTASQIDNKKVDIALRMDQNPMDLTFGTEKGVVYIDVLKPENQRKKVTFDMVLKDKGFNKDRNLIPIGISTDGNVITTDYTEFPHCLVVGTTGSGKSVFLKNIIASLIYKNSPEELQIILCDIHARDFLVFRNAPQLAMGVLTNIEAITKGIAYAISVLDARKKENEIALNAGKENIVFPRLILMIDELDAIYAQAKKEVNGDLIRLAKESRKFQINLIIGSQKPDGANMDLNFILCLPGKICLQVESDDLSKAIIGSPNGHKLAGNGDLIFKDGTNLIRAQGFYVDNDDIKKIIAKLKYEPLPVLIPEDLSEGKEEEIIATYYGEETEDFPEETEKIFKEKRDKEHRSKVLKFNLEHPKNIETETIKYQETQIIDFNKEVRRISSETAKNKGFMGETENEMRYGEGDRKLFEEKKEGNPPASIEMRCETKDKIDIQKKAIELKQNGYTITEIGEELNISRATAGRYVKGIAQNNL